MILKLRSSVLVSLAYCFALYAPNAHAASINGAVVVNVTGVLQAAVTNPAVTCSATVFLAPSVTSTTALSAVAALPLLMAGGQSASAIAGVSSPTSFSCTVNVPYIFNNVGTGVLMGVAFKVEGSDLATGKYFGNTRQIAKTVPIPANGTTTTIPVTVVLP